MKQDKILKIIFITQFGITQCGPIVINLFLAAAELMNETDGWSECPIFVRYSTVAPLPPLYTPAPAHPVLTGTDSTVLLQFLQVLPKILPDFTIS